MPRFHCSKQEENRPIRKKKHAQCSIPYYLFMEADNLPNFVTLSVYSIVRLLICTCDVVCNSLDQSVA